MGPGIYFSAFLVVILLHQVICQEDESTSTICRVSVYYTGDFIWRQATNITNIPQETSPRAYPICCAGYVYKETPDCDSGCPSGSCVFGYCPPDDEKVNCQCYDDDTYPGEDTDCIPVCSPSEDGECTCHAGYTKDEKTNLCVPTECLDRCVNGRCDQLGTCTCDEGFVKHTKRSGLCVPSSCDENCFHGTCTTNGTCSCDEGFKNLDDETCEKILVCPSPDEEDAIFCKAMCDAQCFNGDCTEDGACNCNTGYKKSSEGNFICTAIMCPSADPEGASFCKSYCESKCVTGKCNNDGSCHCVPGYKKSRDDFFTCNQISCPSSDSEDNEYCKEKCSDICLTGSCSDEGRCTCAIPTELPEQED